MNEFLIESLPTILSTLTRLDRNDGTGTLQQFHFLFDSKNKLTSTREKKRSIKVDFPHGPIASRG